MSARFPHRGLRTACGHTNQEGKPKDKFPSRGCWDKHHDAASQQRCQPRNLATASLNAMPNFGRSRKTSLVLMCCASCPPMFQQFGRAGSARLLWQAVSLGLARLARSSAFRAANFWNASWSDLSLARERQHLQADKQLGNSHYFGVRIPKQDTPSPQRSARFEVQGSSSSLS